MSKQLLGKEVSAALNAETTEQIQRLGERGVTPCLAIVRLGESADDLAYENSLKKRCAVLGVALRLFSFSENLTQVELLSVVGQINQDATIHGCLIFRPLPKHIDEEAVCETLAPAKDVDGITSASMAAVYAGRAGGFAPCTARACLEVLDYYGIDLQGKNVLVIGRSLVIGRPVAMLLLQRHATVGICHTRTQDMAALCRRADILIAAAGKAGMVDASFVSEGQILIDVGINVDAAGRLCGDIKATEVAPLVGAYTPVPGGVGTVTTAVLLKQVVAAACTACGLN